MSLLNINDLHIAINKEKILNGFDININKGEVHAIMGPNGSGKSTLSYFLSGKSNYNVINGEVTFNGKDLLDLDPNERSLEGLFLAYQYPVELPGVTTMSFLKSIINAKRKFIGLDDLDPIELVNLVKSKASNLGIEQEMLKRYVNVGFSGGEKKRFEILQMSLLDPILSILDETDSGLDIDALRLVGSNVTNLKSKNNSLLVITHYQRLLDYIIPDFVHILINGKICESGGPDLARVVEKEGYSKFINA